MNGVSEIFMSTKLYTLSKQRGTFHTTADALLSTVFMEPFVSTGPRNLCQPFAAVIGVEHKMCNIINRPLYFSEQHDNAAAPTMKPSECSRITAAKAFKVTNSNTGLATPLHEVCRHKGHNTVHDRQMHTTPPFSLQFHSNQRYPPSYHHPTPTYIMSNLYQQIKRTNA